MLHVLVIDDDIVDVELMTLALERIDRKVELRHATDEAEICAMLQDPVDIVLCDYMMPSITARQAIKLVRQHSASLPVVVVSNSIGEEAVVALFRAGASDYLSKDKLALLPTVIERVLRRARMVRSRVAALARLKLLSGRLIETEDRERAALARDLHDNLGQLLTGIMIRIDNVKAGDESWDSLTELVQHAVRVVKTMSFALRPTQLDSLGIVPAANAILNNQLYGAGLRIDFLRRGVVPSCARPAHVVALRVLQEAATNVARHAGATRLVVRMHFIDQNCLIMCVADNGIGFDVSSVLAGGIRPENQGLHGMIERAELAGGRLRLRSSPERGTTLRLAIGKEFFGEGA